MDLCLSSVTRGTRVPQGVCVCWFAQRSLYQQLDRGCSIKCQHLEQQGSGASTPELTKCPNPAPGSFHTIHENICIHIETQGGTFVCVGSDCCAVLAQTCVYLNAFWMSMSLLGIQGWPCYRLSTVAWSPNSLAFIRLPNSETPYHLEMIWAFIVKTLHFFVIWTTTGCDAKAGKNSLQTQICCHISPIFIQAERWMWQEKLFLQSSWIILHQETAGKEKLLEKDLEIRNCAQSVNDGLQY